jgi:magnesium transporter
MVINCAAYQGGCRVADIDLDQARKVDTSDGRFVWIGLHEPDQPLLRMVQQRFGLQACPQCRGEINCQSHADQ